MAASWQSQFNFVTVYTHIIDACKTNTDILSIIIQLLRADRLFSMPMLLAFMLAGDKEVTVGVLPYQLIPFNNSKVSMHSGNARNPTQHACLVCLSQHSRINQGEASPQLMF
jgi:hypothetical protein